VPGEVRRMFAATSAKTVENTTTETSIVPTGVGSLAVATNYLIPGSSIRITALGTFKTAATPTLTLRLSLGPNELITTGAISLPTIPLHSGWRLIGNAIRGKPDLRVPDGGRRDQPTSD
jgi:hypothetical protein